jgi:SAM-dependent methyltransferase
VIPERWLAERLAVEGLAPVVDVGCGDGRLADELPARWPVVGVDIDGWAGVDVLADGAALPIRRGGCGAVAALWVLHLLDDPSAAVREAHRVLRAGGRFASCTTARDDSPELLAHLPPQPATTFDAEEAPALVASVFDDVEVIRWDGAGEHLPTRAAVAAHLVARDVDPSFADSIPAPLTVTRRGVLVWARR